MEQEILKIVEGKIEKTSPMNPILYQAIAEKYGNVASWAIWSKAGDKPKSNVGDMRVFDPSYNPKLMELLNANVIMIGLNISRDVNFDCAFRNFHDTNPSGQDYKIRYAFQDTEFYGAYMTDVLKNLPMMSSKDVLKYLKKNPSVIEENIRSLCQEFDFIGANKPTILAFGSSTFDILKSNLDKSCYGKLVKLTHYSHQIGQVDYKREVLQQLTDQLGYVASIEGYMTDVLKHLQTIRNYFGKSEIISEDEVKAFEKIVKHVSSIREYIHGNRKLD